MAEDDHDDDHHGEPNTFINSPATSSIGVLAALLAYWICLFAYVENDCAALEKLSREGKQVKWTTFDKHFYSTPSRFIQPASKEELIAVVKQAVETSQPVRVVGAGHSWSPLGLTDGWMINLDKLDKIIEIDAESKTVTVEAGIRIRDLSQRLAEHDPPLALANTGVLDRQSLAGALATGTHGTGTSYPIMSAAIRAAEVLTSDGQLIFVAQGDDREDEEARDVLDALKVHLGALGIVTLLRLQVVDAFSMVRRSSLMPLESYLSGMQARAEAADHLLAWWIPYTDTVQVLESNRTVYGHDPDMAARGLWQSVWSRVHYLLSLGAVQMRLLSAAAHVSSHFPRAMVPHFNRYLIGPIFNCLTGRGSSVFIQQGYTGLILDDHPDEYRETEYFVHSSNFTKAWGEFKAFLDDGRQQLGANFVVQFRFTAADDILLSPVSGGGGYYVAVAMLIKAIQCDDYFRGASEIWLRHGGRPHWGKLHYLEQKDLAAIYGPRLEKFDRVRRKLDPDGVFLNSYLSSLLLPRAIK